MTLFKKRQESFSRVSQWFYKMLSEAVLAQMDGQDTIGMCYKKSLEK